MESNPAPSGNRTGSTVLIISGVALTGLIVYLMLKSNSAAAATPNNYNPANGFFGTPTIPRTGTTTGTGATSSSSNPLAALGNLVSNLLKPAPKAAATPPATPKPNVSTGAPGAGSGSGTKPPTTTTPKPAATNPNPGFDPNTGQWTGNAQQLAAYNQSLDAWIAQAQTALDSPHQGQQELLYNSSDFTSDTVLQYGGYNYNVQDWLSNYTVEAPTNPFGEGGYQGALSNADANTWNAEQWNNWFDYGDLQGFDTGGFDNVGF